MPDLQINVVTKADTTGLDEVKTKLGGITDSVASQLAAAGATFDPARGIFTSAAKDVESIGFGATFAGAQLNKARGEATVLAREIATGSVNARTIGALLGALGTPITIAAIAGLGLFKVFDNIGKAIVADANEFKKMTEELDKQETSWFNLANAADNFGDALKLSEKIQPELDKVASGLEALKNRSVGIWDDIKALGTQSLGATPYSWLGSSGGKTQKDADVAAQLEFLTNQLLRAKAAGDEATQSALNWQIALGRPPSEGIIQYSGIVGDLKVKVDAAYDAWTKLITTDPAKAEALRGVWVQLVSLLQIAQGHLAELTNDQNKLNQGADRTAEAAQRREINDLLKTEANTLSEVRQQQELIKANPFLSIQAQQEALHNLALREQAIIYVEIQKDLAEISKLKTIGDPKNTAEIDRLIAEVQKLETEYQKLGFTIQQTTFTGAIQADFNQWANSFGSVSTQVFNTFKQAADSAFSSLNQYIVTGTFNLQNFLQSLELLALRLIEQLALQEILNLIGGEASVATAKAIGPQIAAAYAGAATAVSTATYGIAPAVGAAAELAALGTITGALAGGGGFRKGGYTGDGSADEIAGPAHKGEFFFSAEETNALGVPFLKQLAANAGGVARFHRGGAMGGEFGVEPSILTQPSDTSYVPQWMSTQPYWGGDTPPGGVNIYGGGPTVETPTTAGEWPMGGYGTFPLYGQPISGPTELPTDWNYDPSSGYYIPSAIPVDDSGGAGGMLHALGWHLQFHSGGLAPDELFGILQRGEFTMQRAAVEHYGSDLMHAMNEMRVPSHHTGGAIGNLRSGAAGGSKDSHVHVYPMMERRAILQHLASREGKKIIFDAISGRRIDLGL